MEVLMNIFRFLEILTFLVLFAGLITQVIVPMLTGRPVFPLFRKRAKLEAKIVDLNEKKDENVLKSKIRRAQSHGSKRP